MSPPTKPPRRRPSLGEFVTGMGEIAAKGSRLGLVVILRAAEVNRAVLEKIGREMAEAEDEAVEWSKLKPSEKHVWTLRAASAIRALGGHFEGVGDHPEEK